MNVNISITCVELSLTEKVFCLKLPLKRVIELTIPQVLFFWPVVNTEWHFTVISILFFVVLKVTIGIGSMIINDKL